jgi:uncharacterized protein YbjT (DUF2867 family)
MILVAGGTGRLGKEIVRLLVARGEHVRVFARHPVAGIDMVTGDVRDAGAVALAMVGVKTVVSAVHGFASDPRGIDLDGNANLLSAATPPASSQASLSPSPSLSGQFDEHAGVGPKHGSVEGKPSDGASPRRAGFSRLIRGSLGAAS